MKNLLGTLLLALTICLFSCKDDVKSDIEDMTEVSADGTVTKVSDEDIQQSNDDKVRQSIMTKIMMTPELSSFARYSVSANLANMLSTAEGPFTIFAPSSDAFTSMSEDDTKRLTDQNNRTFLPNLLRQHILAQKLGTDDMVQALRDADTLAYSSLTGMKLKVFREGDILYVMDSKGHEAAILESDIMGNNGTVHIIDAVLGMD